VNKQVYAPSHWINLARKAQYLGKKQCYTPSRDGSDSVGIGWRKLHAANSKLDLEAKSSVDGE
jgi:hypothetical protein